MSGRAGPLGLDEAVSAGGLVKHLRWVEVGRLLRWRLTRSMGRRRYGRSVRIARLECAGLS